MSVSEFIYMCVLFTCIIMRIAAVSLRYTIIVCLACILIIVTTLITLTTPTTPTTLITPTTPTTPSVMDGFVQVGGPGWEQRFPGKCFSCERQLPQGLKWMGQSTKCFSCERQMMLQKSPEFVHLSHPNKCYSCEAKSRIS